MKFNGLNLLQVILVFLFFAHTVSAEVEVERGEKLFRQCLACHSIAPGEHLTGPSLAGVVGRKAASVIDFGRYSSALKRADITWTEANLDEWLKSPGRLVPGTSMRIRGIDDPGARQDIVAYLKTADGPSGSAESGAEPGSAVTRNPGGSRLVDLRTLSPNQQIAGIRHCGDAYEVTLGTGKSYTFWEFNLRFKTDSSDKGPLAGKPAIMRSGMQGDRAFIIFAGPGEISQFIHQAC